MKCEKEKKNIYICMVKSRESRGKDKMRFLKKKVGGETKMKMELSKKKKGKRVL